MQHLEVLLGLVKVLAKPDRHPPDRNFWRERAKPAIAKTEAILAGASDPDIIGTAATCTWEGGPFVKWGKNEGT